MKEYKVLFVYATGFTVTFKKVQSNADGSLLQLFREPYIEIAFKIIYIIILSDQGDMTKLNATMSAA